MDNLLEAKEVLGQVKSRGVTRFLDLNRLNRQHIDDINEDEEMISDHEADDYVPEAKRCRLAELQNGAESDDDYDYEPSIADDIPHDDDDDQPPDDGHRPSPGLMGLPEESPLSPGHMGQSDGLMGPLDAPPAPMAEPPQQPTLPITDRDEVEPSAEVFPPTPAAGQVMATAERFQVPQQETFEQRRARVDRQETLSFGPRRSQLQSSHGATPYDRPARGDFDDDDDYHDDDDDANMAFNAEDMEQDSLPGDWRFKPETGYFELREGARVRDFWELKAGCHHCHQRRALFDPAGSSDIPVPLESSTASESPFTLAAMAVPRPSLMISETLSIMTKTYDSISCHQHGRVSQFFKPMQKPEKSSTCFPATATTTTTFRMRRRSPKASRTNIKDNSVEMSPRWPRTKAKWWKST